MKTTKSCPEITSTVWPPSTAVACVPALTLLLCGCVVAALVSRRKRKNTVAAVYCCSVVAPLSLYQHISHSWRPILIDIHHKCSWYRCYPMYCAKNSWNPALILSYSTNIASNRPNLCQWSWAIIGPAVHYSINGFFHMWGGTALLLPGNSLTMEESMLSRGYGINWITDELNKSYFGQIHFIPS